MLDERTRQMIEAYIPSPRDPDLEDGEYYYLQSTAKGEQVIRVYALDILPHQNGDEYGIYQQRGCHMVRIDAGYGDPTRGVRKCHLYDNKQDCRDQTHIAMDDWERLRRAEEATR